MNNSDQQLQDVLQCPVGENTCQYLDELAILRQKLDRLSEQVISDELTGLYNYRHMMWALNQEIARTRRAGQPFSVLIIDFDNFKTINDRYGHDFGNKVLRAAGSYFRHSLRALDIPCRFGGEEFVLVLPGTDLRAAVILAERICTGVRAMRLSVDEKHVPLSISVGVDVYHTSDHIDADALLNRVDQYLLQAKRAGKNRVHYPYMNEALDGMSLDERAALMDSFGRPPES